ncbi:unnamed protein product [Rotaria sp. Silwood1]|nr:unnamed protein product [Rotaria sp. Silwood1]
MIQYASKHINEVDKFLLIVSGDILSLLLDDPIYNYPQVKTIYVYYSNDHDLERDKNAYQIKYAKLRFFHENVKTQIIGKLMVDYAINSPRSIEHETLDSAVSSIEQRISTKLSNIVSCHSPKSNRLSNTTTHNYSIRTMEEISSHSICSKCKLVFRESYQFNCGHRTCESCTSFINNQRVCLTCFEVSSWQNIQSDRGFSRDIQQKLISCSMCTWVGSSEIYQQHIDQQHYNSESKAVLVDAYTQLYEQNNLDQTVDTSGTQQDTMSNVFSSSCSIFLPHHSSMTNNQQQIHSIIRHNHILFQTLAQSLSINYDFIAQERRSIQRILDDALSTSYCGEYIWKITDIQQKIGIY